MDIKVMKQQGMSIRAMAGRLGVSRATVRKALTQTVPKEYGPRRARSSKLDQFKNYLAQQMEARPWVRATRLYEELMGQGYKGHYETVKRGVRAMRQQAVAHNRATVRFETGPGVEAQFDWKGYITGLLADNVQQKVWIFRLVLGYSRHRFTRAVTDTVLTTVLADLRGVFEEIGGAPHRLVFDNFKGAVIKPRPNLKLNPMFADFCAHYGVQPWPALAYSPQRKGKVERSFLDLEEGDLLKRQYPDLGRLQEALTADDLRYAQRVHTTTGETPGERLKREAAFLISLPEIRFDERLPETRRVLMDCVISYRGAYYSTPHTLVGRKVTVKAGSKEPIIDIYDGCDLVATHRLTMKGQRSVVDQHIAQLRRPRWERTVGHNKAQRTQQAARPSDERQLVVWPDLPVELRPIEEYANAMEAPL